MHFFIGSARELSIIIGRYAVWRGTRPVPRDEMEIISIGSYLSTIASLATKIIT